MERRDLAGEAYFMRALSYFMLANLYGQPYHPATAGQDLCVPVNDEVSLSDRMMKRATNAVVYACLLYTSYQFLLLQLLLP